MTKTIAAMTALFVLAPSSALAGTASLSIDNRFDGEGEIFIDGRFEGIVAGDQKVTLSLASGWHDISVKRPGTSYFLSTVRMDLKHGTATLLPVNAPAGQLRVTNSGEIGLNVVVDKGTSVWVDAGVTAIFPVTTGHVDVVASIKEPRGEWRADERDVWVEPGSVGVLALSPDPTVIVVTNRDAVPVRALLDGVDAGLVAAGSTERVWVRPGPTNIVLMDKSGAVRNTATLNIKRGDEAKIIVQPSVVFPASTVVVAAPVIHRY